MPPNLDSIESGHLLIQRLDEFNPWWEFGGQHDLTGMFSTLQSGFYEAYNSLHWSDQRVVPVVGPAGGGKTSLLQQLAAAHFSTDFTEKFVPDADRREKYRRNLVPPSNILYLPLAADPVFQIKPKAQLRAAVDHFQTHVLDPQSGSHYLFIDDLHIIERPNKRGDQQVGRWANLLSELVAEHDGRHIVFSALSRDTVRNHLQENFSAEGCSTSEPIDFPPMGFSDFLRMRYREIDLAPPSERFEQSAVRKALKEAITNQNHERFASELTTQQAAASIDASVARREIANYCTAGGLLSLRIADRGVSVQNEAFVDALRGRGELDLAALQEQVISDVRHDLLRAATNIRGVKDASGLERVCALTAHELPTDDVRFDDLTDILDVDRRTVREKYLGVLSQLHLLSGAQEYDNQRPRKLRLYLRDPGLTNAFCRNDLNDVLRQQPGLDEALAKAVAFDHGIRLSSELNHPHDPKRGVVKFWSGSKEAVDFVFKLDGVPVPVLWSYGKGVEELQRSAGTPGFDALTEFLSGDAFETERDSIDEHQHTSLSSFFVDQRREYVQRNRYAGSLDETGFYVFDGTPSFGIVLTNARSALETGVTVEDSGERPVVEVPLWTFLRMI